MIESLYSAIQFDQNSPLPVHEQLAECIKDMVVTGVIPQGSDLPPVLTLAQYLNVSEAEVAAAYRYLLSYHIIDESNKVVSFQSLGRSTQEIGTLTDTIASLGYTPSIIEISKSVIMAEESVAAGQFCKEGRLLQLKRIYAGDGQPFVVVDAFFPLSILTDFDKTELTGLPYYDIIKERYNINFKKSKRSVTVKKADEKICRLLNLKPNKICFRITTRTYDDEERIIEFSHSWVSPKHTFNMISPKLSK